MKMLENYSPKQTRHGRNQNKHGVTILQHEQITVIDGAVTETRDSGMYEFQCPTCERIYWTDCSKRKLQGCLKCFPVEAPKSKASICVGAIRNGITIVDIRDTDVDCVCDCGNEFHVKSYRLRLNQVTGCKECQPQQYRNTVPASDKKQMVIFVPIDVYKKFAEFCEKNYMSLTKGVIRAVSEMVR